jgi:hypothetical protein
MLVKLLKNADACYFVIILQSTNQAAAPTDAHCIDASFCLLGRVFRAG